MTGDDEVSQKRRAFKYDVSSGLLTQKLWFWFFLGHPKDKFTTICLTEEWEKDWVVVRHNKQINTGESGAGFKVAKRMPQVILLPAAADKHLRTARENMKVKQSC